MARLIPIVLACLLASGCDAFTHACTEIGCVDGTNIGLRMPDDRWPAGSYEVDFTIDGATHACAFDVPDDIPEPPLQPVILACEPYFTAQLIPRARCTEQPTGGAVSQGPTQMPNTDCEPIEGAWLLYADFYGQAESLRVAVRRDGETLLDRTLQPEYEESRPNGPDCEPLCRQANVQLMVE
jgi:hypothetical protein